MRGAVAPQLSCIHRGAAASVRRRNRGLQEGGGDARRPCRRPLGPEFLLLKYFVGHRDVVLSRNELLNEVWGYQAMPSTRTVDVHVAWLRQKIQPNPRHPQHVITVHGLGYRFVA